MDTLRPRAAHRVSLAEPFNHIALPRFTAASGTRPRLLRYGVAVLATVLALGLWRIFGQPLGLRPELLLLLAVMLAAWYGGLGPGLLVTVLADLVVDYFFEPPIGTFSLASPTTVGRLALFTIGALGISWLNTALRRSEQRAVAAEVGQRLLAEAGQRLVSTLDLDSTLHVVARLPLPALGDWCVVDLLETPPRSAVAHMDPLMEMRLRELRLRHPVDPLADQSVSQAVHTGRTLVHNGAIEAWPVPRQHDPARMAALQQLEAHSFLVVPLLARGRVLGALSLVSTDPARQYQPSEVQLAEALAERCALAIDNARLYESAERAVRVRDEFLASASHELRTPLSHVKGFVSSLRQTDVEWDEDTRQEFLAEIERETDRLARLIGDLLDMSRLESGTLDHTPRRLVSPASLVAGGLDRARTALGQRPIETHVPDDVLVRVDPSQLERVLANLLENAANYTPPGTPIQVRAANVGGELELCVEDEGPGIPPDQLERIFERFHRARVEGVAAPGTGLGLAICRRIVQAHAGWIWAENRPSGGACFVIRLPLAESEALLAA